MTIKNCYDELGLDFDAVKERLLSEDRVARYAVKFIDNPDFPDLEAALIAEDWNKAFEAAHTLKGVALNLGFDRLSEIDSELTEILRPRSVSDNNAMIRKFNEVRDEYNRIIKALEIFKNS